MDHLHMRDGILDLVCFGQTVWRAVGFMTPAYLHACKCSRQLLCFCHLECSLTELRERFPLIDHNVETTINAISAVLWVCSLLLLRRRSYFWHPFGRLVEMHAFSIRMLFLPFLVRALVLCPSRALCTYSGAMTLGVLLEL